MTRRKRKHSNLVANPAARGKLDIIRAFCQANVPIVPVPRGARPGTSEALTDENEISCYFRKNPEANYAVPTGEGSGIFVIKTVDRASRLSLQGVAEARGRRLKTVTAKRGKWRYFYFRHPGGELPSSRNLLGQGILVRGNGEFVLGPGNVTNGLACEFLPRRALGEVMEILPARASDL